MHKPSMRRIVLASVLAVGVGVSTTATAWASTPPPSRTLAADTRFYVDPGSKAARQGLTDLLNRDFVDAAAMARLASWPEAAWFTKGTV
jgi:endoglucanase